MNFLIVAAFFANSVCASNDDHQEFLNKFSCATFNSAVIRSEENENVMDDEIIERIEFRHANCDLEKRSPRKKISIPAIMLALKITQEVIIGAIKVVEVYKEEKKAGKK